MRITKKECPMCKHTVLDYCEDCKSYSYCEDCGYCCDRKCHEYKR